MRRLLPCPSYHETLSATKGQSVIQGHNRTISFPFCPPNASGFLALCHHSTPLSSAVPVKILRNLLLTNGLITSMSVMRSICFVLNPSYTFTNQQVAILTRALGNGKNEPQAQGTPLVTLSPIPKKPLDDRSHFSSWLYDFIVVGSQDFRRQGPFLEFTRSDACCRS